MEEFKWWRRLLGGVWYKHSSSRDGLELSMSIGTTWWARHYKINRFSDVIQIENYDIKKRN